MWCMAPWRMRALSQALAELSSSSHIGQRSFIGCLNRLAGKVGTRGWGEARRGLCLALVLSVSPCQRTNREGRRKKKHRKRQCDPHGSNNVYAEQDDSLSYSACKVQTVEQDGLEIFTCYAAALDLHQPVMYRKQFTAVKAGRCTLRSPAAGNARSRTGPTATVPGRSNGLDGNQYGAMKPYELLATPEARMPNWDNP